MRIACFISSHGYGHATRCLAILDALSQKFQPLEISIFSSLPNSFLVQNLNSSKFTSHNTKTDIGLIQKTPFEHDLTQTVLEWDQFLNFKSSENQKITESVKEINPDFILCDISPLGIKLGKRLKIPTVLIENFTWDWIYQTYGKDAGPALNYIHPDFKGKFGVIAPYSKDFCKTCNRLRITARGDLRLCLFGNTGTSIRHLLQKDNQKDELVDLIISQLHLKKASHHLEIGDTGITSNLSSTGG